MTETLTEPQPGEPVDYEFIGLGTLVVELDVGGGNYKVKETYKFVEGEIVEE